MKTAFLVALLFTSIIGKSQSQYTGQLGSYPITLVTFKYGDGFVNSFYVYNQYDTPINIKGNLENGELKLFEKDESEQTKATFVFQQFDERDDKIKGQWISADGKTTYPVNLTKQFTIDYDDENSWGPKELLQSESTNDHYFIALVTKEKDNFRPRITGMKVVEKKTDKVIQTLAIDCQLFSIHNVFVGDYNFDGLQDFSVFEQSYSGPNTSSLYFLRDPNTNTYFDSGFTGVSLDFDEERKLVYEHNQCCAGLGHMRANYKIVNNKMVLVEKYCMEYDDETEEFVKVACD